MSKFLIIWIDFYIYFFVLNEGYYNWLKLVNVFFWLDKKVIVKYIIEYMFYCVLLGQLGGFVYIEVGYDNERFWCEIVFLECYCMLLFCLVGCIDLIGNNVGSYIDKLKWYYLICGFCYILDDDVKVFLCIFKVKWGFYYMVL